MIIETILSDYAFISLNDIGEEIIVIGKNISKCKAAGDRVDPLQAQKTLYLTDTTTMPKIKETLASLPYEYMNIVDRIIQLYSRQYNKQLDDSIYYNLMKHLNTTVEEYKANHKLNNDMLSQICQLYQDEYEIGVQGLVLIKNDLHVACPDDQAGFIALDLVSADLKVDLAFVVGITDLMIHIINILRENFPDNINEESMAYYKFITHLKYFSKRVLDHNIYSDDDDTMFDALSKQYEKSYECVTKIKSYIETIHSYLLSKEEELYLLTHIEHVIRNR